MKFITIIILLTINIFATDINNGVKTDYYKNGNIKSTVSYKNGKKEGLTVAYEKNGFLRSESWYKDDLLHKSKYYKTYKEGYASEYGEAGIMFYKSCYQKDYINNSDALCKGLDTSSDYLFSTTVYDREKGIYTDKGYYKHGVIRYETIDYIDVNESREYSESIEKKRYYVTGMLKEIRNRGKKIDLEYYPNGQLAADLYKDKTYPPSIEEFYKVTKLYTISFLREPTTKEARKQLIGTPYKNIEDDYDLRTYHGGDVQEIVPYRNGKKEGLALHIFYNDDDVWFLKTTSYKNGKKNGYETLYKKKGWLFDRKIGTLLNDDSESKSIYDESDVLISKILYRNGEKSR